MSSMVESTKAAAGAAAASTTPAAAAGGSGWTPDRVAAEVQSALREVLGHDLGPDEPFMSGEQMSTCPTPPSLPPIKMLFWNLLWPILEVSLPMDMGYK